MVKHDSEGYVTLPSGIQLKWKYHSTISGNGSTTLKWDFISPFSNKCIFAFAKPFTTQCGFAFAVRVDTDLMDGNYFGCLQSKPTKTSATLGLWGYLSYTMLAIGS